MTGAMIDAQEAKQIGLVNHVTTAEELLPKTISLLTQIISKAPLPLRISSGWPMLPIWATHRT